MHTWCPYTSAAISKHNNLSHPMLGRYGVLG